MSKETKEFLYVLVFLTIFFFIVIGVGTVLLMYVVKTLNIQ